MSLRAIGSTLGVSHPTVMRDIATGTDVPVDEPTGPVTGVNGKTYSPTRPHTEDGCTAAFVCVH